MYKTILKGCNWTAFDLLFFILHSWYFTKVVGESVGYLLGFLLMLKTGVESVLTDVVWMMYCTTEKPKHSAAQQHKWHLASSASLPLKHLMHPRPPTKMSRFLEKMYLFFLALCVVECTLDKSHLLNSLEPKYWFVKWCSLVLALFALVDACYLFVCHVAPSYKCHIYI